jgi:hypothetical protein
VVSLGGKQISVDVAEYLGKDVAVPGTAFALKIDNYWPDFRIEDGRPGSLSEQPNNPAVLVTIRGKGTPAAAPPSPHGASGGELSTNGGPPTMPEAGAEVPNHLTFFISPEGSITYELVSRKNGKSSGKLALNESLTTGWADWQLTIDKMMPHAAQWMDFNPAKTATPSALELPDGLRVRLQQNGETLEQWVPSGWQVSIPTSPQETLIAYGWKTIPLPIGFELMEFEVQRNEGSDSPAGFKSTLRVSTAEGDTATGQCWMNNPFSYPGAWWRTWTGFTYKISQASWNPENLAQSSIQILRDPGWFFKWIGSILIVTGVFMMFYLRPYRKQTVGQPITPSGPKQQKQKAVPAPIPQVVTP